MRVGIVGAGAIGGFLGAELSAGGLDVTLVHSKGHGAPPDPPTAVRADGRVLRAESSLVETDDEGALGRVDICIVAVKSSATEAVAASLERALASDAPVISVQNGLRNIDVLRAHLGSRVTGGVVTYNVFMGERGERHQASGGKLLVGRRPSGEGDRRLRLLKEAFRRSGETLELCADIEGVLAGKLLLNLNNGVCAATGLGIAESIRDRDARFCFAECYQEGLAQMRRAGMRPARVTVLPPSLLAKALKLPDALVVPMARSLAHIHPTARSSTLQDLDRGRATEIDELNGAIVAIAERIGGDAPLNALVTQIVHEHERAAMSGRRPAFVPARELRARMERIPRGRSAYAAEARSRRAPLKEPSMSRRTE